LKNQTLILLAGKGESTSIVYHELQKNFSLQYVLLEDPIPRIQFLQKRIKRLGWFHVLGQVLFQLLMVPCLKFCSKKRSQEIKKKAQLNNSPIDSKQIIAVSSVNSEETKKHLKKLNPDLVIVNGTRIISTETLNCISAPFINMHAGITPQYRGVHGGYWALVQGEWENCGVTIHLVDKGIDTGAILKQDRIEPEGKDNFVTYPLLQLVAGLPLLKEAVNDCLSHKKPNPLIKEQKARTSQLWSHPTLWEYWSNRLKKGIR
jgi:folate-dependent phosphoribosylglycinamide formyltransferase PurN